MANKVTVGVSAVFLVIGTLATILVLFTSLMVLMDKFWSWYFQWG